MTVWRKSIRSDIGKNIIVTFLKCCGYRTRFSLWFLLFSFLQSVLAAAESYDLLMRDQSLEAEERARRVAELTVEGASFEQLALTMTHVAAHTDAAVAVQPLTDNGENIEVYS